VILFCIACNLIVYSQGNYYYGNYCLICHCFGKPTEINRKVSLFCNFINIIVLFSYIVHSLPKNIPLKKAAAAAVKAAD
jgi:hypothetical protein